MQLMKCSRLIASASCALLLPSALFAQNAATFNILTSDAQSQTPGNIYAVDVNNDGLTDIVSDGGYSPAAFYVSINNGNGTFAPPVQYLLPTTLQEPMCIAAADYNRDGRVDLAVPLAGTNQIALYLGKGDGTFQSPILSTINFPYSYYNFTGQTGCAAADFNGDGASDLVAWAQDSQLYVLQGAGNGTFSSSPHLVLSAVTSITGSPVLVGDYDGDGKADIATEASNDSNGTTIYVAYGNNDFTFANTTPYSSSDIVWLGNGDLNGDGITDLEAFTNSPPQQFGAFYGTNARTFSPYWINTPAAYRVGAGSSAQPFTPQLAMADYNGDGRMDVSVMAIDNSGNAQDVLLFLAGSNPGEFTPQAVALPATYDWLTAPVAGLLSGGYLKPDITTNVSNNGSNDTTPTYLPALLNTTSNAYFGFCPYPKNGTGFHVCAAGTAVGNKAIFSAAANSFGKLRKIELWVDGTRVQQQGNAWDTHAYFNWLGTFSNGTHQATFLAYDVDNTVQRYSFTFTTPARH